MRRGGRLNPALAPHRVLSKYVLSGTAWLGWWRAAALRVGSPAGRNARARCSGPPCTTPLDYAPCTGPDPTRRGAR